MDLGSQFNEHTVFHFSREHPNNFMRSGTIHLGDATGAIGRSSDANRRRDRSGTVYALDASQLNIDPDLSLTDAEANTVDRKFLRSRGLPVPRTVDDTAIPSDEWESEGLRHDVMNKAFSALKENRAVRYENAIEGGSSLLAPTPHINMHILNGAKAVTEDELINHSVATGGTDYAPASFHSSDTHDPSTIDKHLLQPRGNPSLPMDWSTMEKSEITKRGGIPFSQDD